MPPQQKRKSQMFIKLDVEGDWVHQIKWPWVDKGKGQMGMVDSEPDDEKAWAQYQVDVHRLVELSKVITCSFEALVLLLVEWLLVPMSGNLVTRMDANPNMYPILIPPASNTFHFCHHPQPHHSQPYHAQSIIHHPSFIINGNS